jgi:hypothetical protein
MFISAIWEGAPEKSTNQHLHAAHAQATQLVLRDERFSCTQLLTKGTITTELANICLHGWPSNDASDAA